MKVLYKNILKYIFFKINKPIILSKHNQKFYSVRNLHLGKKNYEIFTFRKTKVYMDSSEGRYFYIYKNFLLIKPSIATKGLTNTSNIFNYGITKFCKKFNIEVVSIISGKDAKDNYWHWLIDVLPRLIILEKELNNKEVTLLVPDYKKKYQKDSLKYLIKNKKTNYISLNRNRFSQFKKIVSCTNNENFEYLNFSLLSKLRNKILSQAKNNSLLLNNYYEKIFINRDDSTKKNRRILKNSKEVEKFLSENGFKILILSKYSFLEQAVIFNKAKVIIGLQGAGFANIIFSKKKTKIVEITSSQWPSEIKKLSQCMLLNHINIVVNKIMKTIVINTENLTNDDNVSDFTFNVSDTMYDVLSLSLYSYSIPYTWYNIDETYGNDRFNIYDKTTEELKQIIITSGNYTPPELVQEIQTQINKDDTGIGVNPETGNEKITIYYDSKNGKIPLTNPIGKALEGAEEGDEVKVGPNIFKILKLNTPVDMVAQGAVKVEQTVVHGDYIDDRDTIVKDSVISKSNVGAGGKSKSEELREAKALLDDGIIDDDEFKQMKKEILGK